jgi:hypothetical protein
VPGPDTTSTGCGTADGPTNCGADTTGAPTTTGEPGSTTGGSTGGSTSDADSGPATVGIPDECDVSGDCAGGEFCVAPFVPEYGPEGKGPNECVSECVVLMDELRWCLDAVACCDPEAECTDRGYCELPGGDTDGSSSGSDSGGSSTGI